MNLEASRVRAVSAPLRALDSSSFIGCFFRSDELIPTAESPVPFPAYITHILIVSRIPFVAGFSIIFSGGFFA
jgi:hypothetical protein